MSKQTRPRLVYLSAGNTTHDRRFLALAVEHGWAPYWLRCDGRLSLLEPLVLSGVVVVQWLGSAEPLAGDNSQQFIDALRQTVARIRPALIQAGPVTTVGFIAVRAAAAPVLLTSWGSDLLLDVRAAGAHARAVLALRAASRVLVDCQTVALVAMDLGVEYDRIAIVPWGIDLRAFSYAGPRASSGPIRFLSLRSLEPLYDLATLLNGFAKALHNAQAGSLELSIAGSGSQERDLRALAENLGIGRAVRWLGQVPETDVPTLLRNHDLHVSTALADGSALSLLGAMAVGRPSLVSDLPSNREWITPAASGWVFTPADAHSLADAIRQACTARSDFEAMAKRGRAVVEQRANWDVNGSLIANLYREVAQAA